MCDPVRRSGGTRPATPPGLAATGRTPSALPLSLPGADDGHRDAAEPAGVGAVARAVGPCAAGPGRVADGRGRRTDPVGAVVVAVRVPGGPFPKPARGRPTVRRPPGDDRGETGWQRWSAGWAGQRSARTSRRLRGAPNAVSGRWLTPTPTPCCRCSRTPRCRPVTAIDGRCPPRTWAGRSRSAHSTVWPTCSTRWGWMRLGSRLPSDRGRIVGTAGPAAGGPGRPR